MKDHALTGRTAHAYFYAKLKEIVHSEGLNAAREWLREIETSAFLDQMEEDYLRNHKINYVN